MVQSQEPSPPPTWLKIGEVAAKAGVSVDTVRFYERRGLLATPERTPAGYRKYSSSAIDRIVLTRRLRRLGMTLEEIAAALRAEEHGRDCSTELWRLELVRDRIDATIAELGSTRRELVRVIGSCRADDCRIHSPDQE